MLVASGSTHDKIEELQASVNRGIEFSAFRERSYTREKLYCIGERERLQCFSQPTSVITYRRRQMSNLEEVETTQNKLENPHVILLRKKGPHSVSVRGK